MMMINAQRMMVSWREPHIIRPTVVKLRRSSKMEWKILWRCVLIGIGGCQKICSRFEKKCTIRFNHDACTYMDGCEMRYSLMLTKFSVWRASIDARKYI